MIADLEESANPTVGLAAHPGSVDIRISVKADSENIAADMLDKMEKKIRDRVGDAIYGIDTDTIEQVVVEMLRKRGLTLSLIETNTGGLFVSRLTAIHNGFHVMNRANILSIRQAVEFLPGDFQPGYRPPEALATHLANAVRKQSQTAVGAAIVGDEDPDVGPFEKNTGSTCIAVSSESLTECRRIPTGGISRDARVRITNFAFEVLREYLVKKGH
jgi:nicotinamide-nucleotide amidase